MVQFFGQGRSRGRRRKYSTNVDISTLQSKQVDLPLEQYFSLPFAHPKFTRLGLKLELKIIQQRFKYVPNISNQTIRYFPLMAIQSCILGKAMFPISSYSFGEIRTRVSCKRKTCQNTGCPK